jgi:hypothetical protein
MVRGLSQRPNLPEASALTRDSWRSIKEEEKEEQNGGLDSNYINLNMQRKMLVTFGFQRNRHFFKKFGESRQKCSVIITLATELRSRNSDKTLISQVLLSVVSAGPEVELVSPELRFTAPRGR